MKSHCRWTLQNVILWCQDFIDKTVYNIEIGYSRKNPQYTFLKQPRGIVKFVTLPLGILQKTRLHPWKFFKIVWNLWCETSDEDSSKPCETLEIRRSKTNTLEWKLNMSFLKHPQKFHFFFNSPLEFPHPFCNTTSDSMSSTKPPSNFSGIAQYMLPLNQFCRTRVLQNMSEWRGETR